MLLVSAAHIKSVGVQSNNYCQGVSRNGSGLDHTSESNLVVASPTSNFNSVRRRFQTKPDLRRRRGKIHSLSRRQRPVFGQILKQKGILSNTVTSGSLNNRVLVHVHLIQANCSIVGNSLTILAKVRRSSGPGNTLRIENGTVVFRDSSQTRPNVHGRATGITYSTHENLSVIHKGRTIEVKTRSGRFVVGVKYHLSLVGNTFVEVHRHSCIVTVITNTQLTVIGDASMKSVEYLAILIVVGEINTTFDKKVIIVVGSSKVVGVCADGNQTKHRPDNHCQA